MSERMSYISTLPKSDSMIKPPSRPKKGWDVTCSIRKKFIFSSMRTKFLWRSYKEAIAAASLNNVDNDHKDRVEFHLDKEELDKETTIEAEEKLDRGESKDNGGDEDGDHEDGQDCNQSRYYLYSIQHNDVEIYYHLMRLYPRNYF